MHGLSGKRGIAWILSFDGYNKSERTMTREEVKAQLAKSPLRWEDKEFEIIAHVDTGDTPIELHYVLRGDCLNLTVFVNGETTESFIGQYEDVEYLKYAAEECRLELACRLLGVKE